MISSKLRIERWGNDYHGTATVSGCTFMITNNAGGPAFPSIQAIVDAAHERFPIASFEVDVQVMSRSTPELINGIVNGLIATALIGAAIWFVVEVIL